MTVQSTIYYVIHPHGHQMRGRWVGLSYDGPIQSGWSAIARTEQEAQDLLQTLSEGG